MPEGASGTQSGKISNITMEAEEKQKLSKLEMSLGASGT